MNENPTVAVTIAEANDIIETKTTTQLNKKKKAQESTSEFTLSLILIGIVIIFLSCNVFRLILNLLEYIYIEEMVRQVYL